MSSESSAEGRPKPELVPLTEIERRSKSYEKIKPIFDLYHVRMTVTHGTWSKGELVDEDTGKRVGYSGETFDVMMAVMVKDLLDV